jgi:uncharacterized protein GlcG (DUF336 family)
MLREAREMLERARRHAEGLGVAFSVAIVDAGGHLIALERMDGAPYVTVEIAWGKTWTSAAFSEPSAAVADRMETAPVFSTAVSSATHGRLTPRQGALPLPGGGAVGASGGTSQQDEDVARAAIG